MALSTINAGYSPADATTGGDDSSIYQLLLDRCRSLEASYSNLQEQFHILEQEHNSSYNNRKLLQEDTMPSRSGVSSFSNWISGVPDVLPVGFSYKRALDQLGHAVYVSKSITREIIYCFTNRSAEKLFGYEDYEALGQTVTDLLIYDEFHISSEKIMGRVRAGQTWAGQFPFRKRSGVTFMALVNKSPLYEDGELVGIVTVASDATIFNKIKSENPKSYEEDPSNGQTKTRGLKFKKIQWQPPQQLSSFASKDILRKGGGNNRHTEDTSVDMGENILEPENVNLEKPPKAPAAKVLSKLNIQRTGNIQQDGSANVSENHNAVNMSNHQQSSATAAPCRSVHVEGYETEISQRAYSLFDAKRHAKANEQVLSKIIEDGFSFEALRREQNECSEAAKPVDRLALSNFQMSRRELELENDLNSIVDCEIRWEDLDVAVKLKSSLWHMISDGFMLVPQIDIMKRLRHPNVLLFMGGSLFNVLHNSGHSLDIRRRLRMAADVTNLFLAAGKRYELFAPQKSANNTQRPQVVKPSCRQELVGDFGLSKLKHATFLTARSGRGTPQWMAPEVLRNEPSNEKSDVYSFGIILWELVTQSVPWSNMNPLQVVGVVGFMDRRLDLPDDIDPALSSIIQDCWQSNPALRPSFENIMHRLPGLIQKFPG
ncbi:PAS domain-containing protein [Cynara cardunculus var. scolymus]|uniref:PAS domain-containing protein n=1 Tax=Cynara cardunculus var. scolymus TaxID=59895 RepID=A0A103XJE7_CYNCS|nr:PAS domain-containing protein [Cynara cardunculus var. scolymus]